MRKIKVSYEEILDVIALHLNNKQLIRNDEHVVLTPLNLDKNGLLVVYVYPNRGIR